MREGGDWSVGPISMRKHFPRFDEIVLSDQEVPEGSKSEARRKTEAECSLYLTSLLKIKLTFRCASLLLLPVAWISLATTDLSLVLEKYK